MRYVTAFLIALALLGCNRSAQPAAPVRDYAMRGEVVRVDPQGHLATIKNEKIEGWMEPMTMEYPVKDAQDFARLQAGETIRATVHVQGNDFWVSGVQPEPPSK